MTRSRQEVEAALWTIRDMPDGLAMSVAAEQELRRVEAEGPVEALPLALETHVMSLARSEQAIKAYAPFARLVRLWSERPELFTPVVRENFFGGYTWMVGTLVEFPDVPATQIESALDTMTEHFAAEGYGLREVAHTRMVWAEERGVGAEEAMRAWVTMGRDTLSQPASYEDSDQMMVLHGLGRHDEVIVIGERALDRWSATTDPDGVACLNAYLQLAYLEVGREGAAVEAHRRCLTLLPSCRQETQTENALVVEFLARAGHPEAALHHLRSVQDVLTGAVTPRERLEMLCAAGTAAHVARQVDPDLAVDLPATGARTVSELDDWLRAEATALATAFDARNGTDRWAGTMARAWSTVLRGTPVRLGVVDLSAPADVASSGGPDAETAHDDPDGTMPDTAPDPVAAPVARAEQHEQADDHPAAAHAWHEASTAAERAGRTVEAGLLLAEGARCAYLAQDRAGAVAGLQRALALLEAGGTDVRVAGPVARLLAEVAASVGSAAEALPTLDRLLQRSTGSDGTGPDEARRERALLLDVTGRLHAELGRYETALDLAQEAADDLRAVGRPLDVAHSEWLTARVHAALAVPDAAVRHLRLALDALDNPRHRTARARLSDELITALRAAGRHTEAAAVTI